MVRSERNQQLQRSDAGDHHQDDFQDRRLRGPHPAQVASGHSPGQCLRGGNGFFHPTVLQRTNPLRKPQYRKFHYFEWIGQSVPGIFNTSGSDAVFTPSAALYNFREYRIQIGTGITNLSRNFLDGSSEASLETLGNVVISPADPEGMILISGGRFMMGADSQTDSDAEENEGPVHSVTLKGPFYISDHEVTVGEYKACVDAGGCSQPGSGTYPDKLSLPVNKVSWIQANEFAQWKTSQASKTYCLCTSAEWEYAGRAGTTTPWSFPEDANPQDCT